MAVWEELQRANNPNRQILHMQWHLLSAAIVLDRIIGSMDILDENAATPNYSHLRITLRQAVHFLDQKGTLEKYEKIYGAQELASLRRFWASSEQPDPSHSIHVLPSHVLEIHEKNSSTSLLEEFAMLENQVPSECNPQEPTTNDDTLMANISFFLEGQEY